MLTLAGLAAVPAHADVKAGVDAWTAGDFAGAVREWAGPAAQGDPDAQFNMGQAYRLGRGVETDVEQAEALYAKAAAQGHVKAADNYGLLLFQRGAIEHAGEVLGTPREARLTTEFKLHLLVRNPPFVFWSRHAVCSFSSPVRVCVCRGATGAGDQRDQDIPADAGAHRAGHRRPDCGDQGGARPAARGRPALSGSWAAPLCWVGYVRNSE